MSDDQPTSDPVIPPPAVPRVVVPRWVQLVALPLLVVMLWALARAAGSVLLIFGAAAIGAMVLNPLVNVLRRARVPRGASVLLVLAAFVLAFAGAGFLLANPVVTQAKRIQHDVPNIIDSANDRLADLQTYFDDHGIDVEIKKQGEPALQTLEEKVLGGAGDVVSFGGELLTSIVAAGFSLILTFVVMVYMLLYGERIGDWIRRMLASRTGARDTLLTPEEDYPKRIQHAVSSYVRGQALFSLLMGAGATIGLYVFGLIGLFPAGRTYAVAFGVFFGLMELIPYIGPVLGAIPPVLVALFEDPLTAVWVILLFVALQQLEGHVVAPQVFGRSLRINPLLVIFALLVGGELYGLVGALLALPIAAVLRETLDYLREHLVLERWDTVSPVALMTGSPPDTPGSGAPPGPAAFCPRCGTQAQPGDAHCRVCGAPLGPPG